MSWNFSTKCPVCDTIVGVVEQPMGVPGGKEREEANCPICGEVVFSAMTDGWFNTSIVSMDETIEPYKSRHQQ